MIHHLKQYPFSLVAICAVSYLSLCPMPQTEMDDIPFIDKWVHLCMYGGLSGVIWIEYMKSHRPVRFTKAILPTAVFPLVLSGSLELLQTYCTATRNGEWLDMAANSMGVVSGTVVGYFIIRPFMKRRKEKAEAPPSASRTDSSQ